MSDHLRFSWLRPTFLLGHARLGLILSLVILTATAWMMTLYHSRNTKTPMDGMSDMAMDGMSHADWSLAGAGAFVALWTVMMAAMMLPAAAPMIVMFASVQTRRTGSEVVSTWIFVSGYLLVWLVAGLLVHIIVQIARDIPPVLSSAPQADWGSIALGFTVIAAGLYQFTPLKRVCLRHCRSPLAFVVQHWRDGKFGSVLMGLQHGTYCLGCCWVLFAVLVVAGTMSVAWMLLLTLFVFAEKVFPHGQRISAAIGIALVVLGILISSGTTLMQI